MTNPNDYNLPHGDWRKGQENAVGWCLDMEGVGIAEAPTGSGKTAYAAAVASQMSVIALCRTKNLQAENYGRTYGFDVLYGKANYPCSHPDAVPNATGSDCLHQESMYKCPYKSQCEYLAQKALCQASSKVSLNYAYYLTAQWPRIDPPQVLFLDEAHELSKTVLDYVGCTITDRDRVEWQLDSFPELRPSKRSGMLTKHVDTTGIALSWLADAKVVLRQHSRGLANAKTKTGLDRKRKCERLGMKVRATLDALRDCADDWYISSGMTAQEFRGKRRPAFICRPLTAKYAAKGFFGFDKGQTSILMSATIGKLAPFAEELGIRQHEFLSVENQFTAAQRPVYILDCPSMSSKATPMDFERQADVIAKAILSCPHEWPGIIHVTRKRESKLLADRLARRGLQGRMWPFPGHDGTYEPTDRQIAAWEYRKKRVPNSIGIPFSLWCGFDGLVEKICIVAKAPYPVWGSGESYAAAWRGYSMKRYQWQTANLLAQGLGRTRRGREQDYDMNGEFNGFVAVADSSWTRVKGYMPTDILDSFVEI